MTNGHTFYFMTVIFAHIALDGYCFKNRDERQDGVVEIFTNATYLLQNCRFPDYFQLRINLQSQHEIVVNLRKHPTAHNRFPPTYLLSRLPRHDLSQQDAVRYVSNAPDSHILVECNHEKKSKFLHISGVILYKREEFVIQSLKDNQASKLGLLFVRWHKIIDVPGTHDYVISEKSRFPSVQEEEQLSRDRREVMRVTDVLTFTINALVVVDFNVYSKWLSFTGGRTAEERSLQAKKEIRKYYLHVINGVDLRYQSIRFHDFQIRVELSGIVIIDNRTSLDDSAFEATPSSSPLTNETNEMDADTALKNFRSWVNDTAGLPKHNHAILFTGYDLYTSKSNGSNEKQSHTSGLAFIGTLCEPGDSVSIVEEQGGFQSIGTAAHEIGHSLGALHDGENNTCHSEDRYIMAASGFGPVPEDKKYNPWIFSRCSVEYFKDFITSLLLDGSTCLTDKKINITDVPEVKTNDIDLPGQHYSPDDQCRLIWGPTSYLCRGPEFGNASTICTAMYCRDPSTDSDCVLHIAARGTTCGNKQWCMDGNCVFSSKASERQDSCILGDQPGPAFNAMTCEELIAKSPSYCYQEKVRSRCCHSCWSKYTYRKGCEYGDRIQGCRLWHCSHVFESRDIQAECCGTCEHGEIVTPPEPDHFLPTEGHISTTSPAKWTAGICTDTASFSCSEYIRSRGSFVCYSNVTSDLCCRTCEEFKTKEEGCEYGDRVPSLCANMKNVAELDCAVYGELCCRSCVKFDTVTPVSSSSLFSYSMNFVIFNIILLFILTFHRV